MKIIGMKIAHIEHHLMRSLTFGCCLNLEISMKLTSFFGSRHDFLEPLINYKNTFKYFLI